MGDGVEGLREARGSLFVIRPTVYKLWRARACVFFLNNSFSLEM